MSIVKSYGIAANLIGKVLRMIGAAQGMAVALGLNAKANENCSPVDFENGSDGHPDITAVPPPLMRLPYGTALAR